MQLTRSIHKSMTAQELRAWFAALPDIHGDTKWDEHRVSLRNHARNEASTEFLKWSTVQATMFVGNAPYISRELADLKKTWSRWSWALPDAGFGEPILYDEEFSLLDTASTRFRTSGNYIHQAYRLKQWEQRAKVQMADMRSIVEFGGGYGALRVIANNLGFDGQYNLFDLPEMNILQEYYVSNVIPGNNSTQYISHVYDLPREVDLLVAVASLSETPVDIRNQFLDTVDARYYYIIFQPRFHGVDNVEYFRKFMESKTSHRWEYWTDKLIPHTFLMGVPR